MTRIKFFQAWAVLVLLAGCHSAPLHSPPLARKSSGQRDKQNDKWQSLYVSARARQTDDPAKACAEFKALAANSAFALHDLAQLRAVESCPPQDFANFDRAILPAWLQDQAIDVLLQKAAQRADKNSEMDLAVEKSKQKLSQSEKVKWMNLALHDADQLNLPDRSKELKTRLYGLAPRLETDPPEKRFLTVAGDWRFARQFDKAREYYEKVLASPAYSLDDKISALKGLRIAYKNARKNDAHVATSRRLIAFLRKAEKAAPNQPRLWVAEYQAQVYLARALWTLGELAEAKAIFNKLEKHMRGKISLAELYWLQGRMAEEGGDLEKVSDFLNKSLKERFTDPDLHDKVFWYSAWNERRRKDFPRAIEMLKDIDGKTTVDFTRQRALFWLGQTYMDNHQPEEAQKTFVRLMDLDPLGYYGLLAHRQLKQPIAFPVSSPETENSADTSLPLNAQIADGLEAVDERDTLTAYLDFVSYNYKRQPDQTDAGWVTLFKNYARAGLYMKLYESLGTLTPDQRKSVFDHHPELLFPRPWNEDAAAAAAKFGIQEELIYSIIRQESAFDPRARSLADAFGLMQLLPEVAENLSAKYKIPYTGMEDLFDPKTNIYFGAAHLKELFQRQNGQFILAVASYNASESVIRTWMKTRFHDNALEFIEDIPYEETRSYVRLVMRNLVFYGLLKSNASAVDFPEWVLKLGT